MNAAASSLRRPSAHVSAGLPAKRTTPPPLGLWLPGPKLFGEYFIPLVVVSDASRRTGVGRQLMTHLERVASAQKVFTSTNTSNLPMRQLLAQLGYQHSGTIENLDPGDPELVFVKFMR